MVLGPPAREAAAPAPKVTLRPVTPADDPFLLEVYASTRQHETAGWDPVATEAFNRIQYRAQQAGYEGEYPDADWSIVLANGRPVGRMIVHRTAVEIFGVDLALLSDNRSAGIGSTLILSLLDEARRSRRPFRIAVERTNRAIRLYRRLGLVVVGETATHYRMAGPPELVAGVS